MRAAHQWGQEMANEEQLARIKQLERIAALEHKAAAPKDPAQPSVAAIGSPDGPQAAPAARPSFSEQMGQLKKDPNSIDYDGPPTALDRAMEPVKRVLSIPAGVTRVAATGAVGNLLPSANGKNMAENSDYIDALKGQAPGVGDMIARKYPGLSEGLKGIINKGGNFALDPLMWGGLQKMGKGMYDASINPIEVEGQRFGKSDVGDVLNKNGIKNPLTLQKTVQAAVDKNSAVTDQLEAGATAKGATADMTKAVQPAQEFVNNLKRTARAGSDEWKMAKEMQDEIDNHLQSNLPGGSTVQPNTPENTSQWKTDAGKKVSQASRDVSRRGTAWDSFYKSLAQGLRGETENAIGQGMGPEAQAEYQNTNADIGKMLSTGRAQQRVQGQAMRLKDAISTPVPTGTEGFTGALTAALTEGSDPLKMLGHGATAVAIQKAVKAAQLAQMPVGYMLRNTPSAVTTGASAANNLTTPWKEVKNGEK